MKKLATILGMAPLLLGATLSARADTLHIKATADNQFTVYLATDAQFTLNQLGTQIGSNPAGNNWQVAYTLPSTVLPNSSPLYLQIVLTNWTPNNGFPLYPNDPTANPSAFIGDLSITGSNYKFANGQSTISSNPTDWLGSTTTAPGTWTATTTGVASYGTNDGSPNIWTNANGNHPIDLSSGAQWIFYGDQATAFYSDLSLKISASRTNIGAAPLPAAWTMMLLGLAGSGAVSAYRRKRAKV